jgi:hypothetical protein
MQELTIFLCNCLKAHVLSINIFPFLRALAHCLPVLEDEDQRLYHKNMKIIFPNYLAYPLPSLPPIPTVPRDCVGGGPPA